MFTKQHYKAIAKVIEKDYTAYRGQEKAYGPSSPSEEGCMADAIEDLVYNLADYFAENNKLFNRSKFYRACGICGSSRSISSSSVMDKEKLYDLIYDKADRLFKQYNPCNIHFDKTQKQITCNYYKNSSKPHYGKLCCSHGSNECKHHRENGCTIKCLACKLYYCYAGNESKKVKEFFPKLRKLKKIANKYNILGCYFISKKDMFKE